MSTVLQGPDYSGTKGFSQLGVNAGFCTTTMQDVPILHSSIVAKQLCMKTQYASGGFKCREMINNSEGGRYHNGHQ